MCILKHIVGVFIYKLLRLIYLLDIYLVNLFWTSIQLLCDI